VLFFVVLPAPISSLRFARHTPAVRPPLCCSDVPSSSIPRDPYRETHDPTSPAKTTGERITPANETKAKLRKLSPLECELTENAPITPLESALTQIGRGEGVDC